MNCLVGIDIGTTGSKVTVYNTGGEILDTSYREYFLEHPQTGWAVIDPFIWWQAICESFKEIWERGKVRPAEVAGVGVSSTNALVLVDEHGIPLAPAVMQLDQRASPLVAKIKGELGETFVQQITGNRITSGAFWGPTLLWFKSEEAETLRRVKRFHTPHSFITHMLTNCYTIDHSRAATTMLFDLDKGTWDQALCDYFAVNPDLLPPILDPCDVAGKVTKRAAELTGLLAGTPVIAGCMDSMAAQVGLGAGDSIPSLVLGSVGRICLNTEKCDQRFMNTKSLMKTRYFSMAPINGAGISYKWLKQILFHGETARLPDQASHLYERMDQLANTSSAGARGIIYQPYIAGERSPIWDFDASGSFFGLRAEHRQADLIRAVLEGVGYALLHNLHILEHERNEHIPFFHAGGGGAKSAIWLQILSDILGKPIKVPDIVEAETLGVAVLAGVATGVYRDVEDGIRKTFHIQKEYHPNLSAHEIYQQCFEIYTELYHRNSDLQKKIKRIRQQIG